MDLMTVTRHSGIRFTARVRDHEITSDFAVHDGGQDEAMSPVELMAASLGLCIATMVQIYCDRHGWEGDVEVSMAVEMADHPKRVGRFTVDLELPPSVPEDRQRAIRAVAERCPVHETFLHAPEIDLDFV